MPAAPSSAVEILLVEDSPADADLMVEALQESAWHNRVTVLDDGEKAVLYLRRQGAHASAPRPDLILLDLHLPRKSGHEVLAEIKADSSLRLIPVIILTSADSDEAFAAAYDLHANCCVRKPTDLDAFTATVHKIERFWLQVASRPRGQGSFPNHRTPPEG
jgi:two-component system, chemotaxis family, response regulator Rcp1